MPDFPKLRIDRIFLVPPYLGHSPRLFPKLLSHSFTGNPFRTMEEELLLWEPAVGFPCLDADDCANPSNAARIPDVEVQSAELSALFATLLHSIFKVRRNFDHVMFATHRDALPYLFP